MTIDVMDFLKAISLILGILGACGVYYTNSVNKKIKQKEIETEITNLRDKLKTLEKRVTDLEEIKRDVTDIKQEMKDIKNSIEILLKVATGVTPKESIIDKLTDLQ